MKKPVSVILAVMLLLFLLPSAILAVNVRAVATKTVGDLDYDGEITDWDGILLARHLSGWATTVADEKILDIDGDGEITDWDGVMLDRHLAGWPVVTQVGKGLPYSITYANTKGASNTNPTSYRNGGAEIQLTPISAQHYSFDGWFIGDEKVTHIPTDFEKDLTIAAQWTPVVYTISYANTKGVIHNNPENYNIESNTIVLEDLMCEGYRFDGWYLGNKKVTNIPAGSSGDITLTAQWTACDYKLSYENTKGATNNNPIGFSTDSAAIVLTALEKEGYTFDGWYNGNTKVTTIPSGTIGNITLTAQWTPITYTITYQDEKALAHTNPTNYTTESNTITLEPLRADGYFFDGWYNGNTKVTSIKTGSTGDLVLTAKWSIITYTITYQNTKDVENNNPIRYTTEDVLILEDLQPAATYLGYSFDGWYVGEEKVTEIKAGSFGNLTLTAKWKPFVYTFEFSGVDNAENPNALTTTTIETWPGDYVLQSPSREGYLFNGWVLRHSGGFMSITTITIGKIRARSFPHDGKVCLIAQWTPIDYPIMYTAAEPYAAIISHSNPVVYNADSSITLQDPAPVAGYVFGGWYEDAAFTKPITAIEPGRTGSLKLYAKYTFTGTWIYDKNDFAEIVYDPSGSYMLANDVYIDDTICNSPTPFTGVFNGNGYAVTGPKEYNSSSGQYVATAKTMFGENAGLIVNTISKGGIANYNSGTIIRCGVEAGYAKIEAGPGSAFGGIVAENNGIIRECYCNSVIRGSRYDIVGGIAGKNEGTIQHCYFTSELMVDDGSTYVGGIVGSNGGSIIGCYAKGYIRSSYSGIFGSIAGGSSSSVVIEDCFAIVKLWNGVEYKRTDMAGSSRYTNCYACSDSDGTASASVTRVDPANFQSKTFMIDTMGWSEDIWYFKNGSLPKLAWEK